MNDKVKHIIAGFLIALVFSIFCVHVGFWTAVVVGILKEVIWDWYLGKGTPEVLDAVATGFGGALGIIPWIIWGQYSFTKYNTINSGMFQPNWQSRLTINSAFYFSIQKKYLHIITEEF